MCAGEAPTRPSAKVAKLFEWVCGSASAVAAIMSADAVVGFVADLLEESAARLARGGPWERGIAAGAVEQLTLDVQFLETALAPLLTDTARRDLAACAEQAARAVKGRRERAARERADYAAAVARAIAQLKSQNVALELPAPRQ